jgi:hypothetical protein
LQCLSTAIGWILGGYFKISYKFNGLAAQTEKNRILQVATNTSFGVREFACKT